MRRYGYLFFHFFWDHQDSSIAPFAQCPWWTEWIVRVKFLSGICKKKKQFIGRRFFKLPRIFLFSSPRERLSRILIKAWLKSPRCLVFSFADQLVPTLLQSCRMLRCAPAREIKSGKGFAEASESKTGFLFLQLYVRARHPHPQEDFIC